MSDADDRSIARRTLIVINLILATLVGLALLWETRRVLSWVVAAAFFAVARDPLADRAQRGLVRRRAAATLLAFLAVFVALAALGVLIVVSLLNELARFAHQAPDLLREAGPGAARSVSCWSASTCGATPRPTPTSSSASAANS